MVQSPWLYGITKFNYLVKYKTLKSIQFMGMQSSYLQFASANVTFRSEYSNAMM